MRTFFALPFVLSLTACAALVGGNFEHLQGTPDYRQCAYQAKSSTPGTTNAFADVMREMELKNMCLSAKGYASR